MKKLPSLLLCAALFLGLAAPVRGADDAVWVLHTDITAQINGHPLRSFNVDNVTAIVAEDLRPYGFYTLWNAGERALDVIRARETPVNWPEYRPPAYRPEEVGSRWKPVRRTDIVTRVAGQEVDAWNIGGETLIKFRDLALFGEVQWDGEHRVSNLELGDPVQIAVDELTHSLETSGLSYSHEVYPCETGALFVGSLGGAPHGTATYMDFIFNSGLRLDIVNEILPYGGAFGSCYYANPREIAFEDNGTVLTFITPVRENIYSDGGPSIIEDVKDYGDTLCRLELNTGTVRPENMRFTMTPLHGTMESWDANFYLDRDYLAWVGPSYAPDGPVTVTVTNQDGTGYATVLDGTLPSPDVTVFLSEDGGRIIHQAAALTSEDFRRTPYGQVMSQLQALLGTPDSAPTAEQLEQAGRYVRVAKNGEAVPYTLSSGHSNNRWDIVITFEQPVPLSDGDTLTLEVGA